MSSVVEAGETGDVPSRVAEIVAKVAATSMRPKKELFLDVLAALETLPGAEKRGDLSFELGVHRIRVAMMLHLEYEVQQLEKIRDLSLHIAPELVSLLPVGDFEGVLVTRYRLQPGERLLGLNGTRGPLSRAKVEQFLRDIRKLVDHGFTHSTTRHGGHWYVGSESGDLLLDRWDTIDPYDEDEAAEMFRDIDKVIKKRGIVEP